MKDVFVKFSAFRSAAVVAPDLVSSVNAAHIDVVVQDRHGARHRYPRTILLAPEDVSRLGLAGGGHDCDNLSIHPRTCTYIAFLDCEKFTSIMCVFSCFVCKLYQEYMKGR